MPTHIVGYRHPVRVAERTDVVPTVRRTMQLVFVGIGNHQRSMPDETLSHRYVQLHLRVRIWNRCRRQALSLSGMFQRVLFAMRLYRTERRTRTTKSRSGSRRNDLLRTVRGTRPKGTGTDPIRTMAKRKFPSRCQVPRIVIPRTATRFDQTMSEMPGPHHEERWL